MSRELFPQNVSLEAASPFELRVNLSRNVSESVVKTALRTGEVGFLHSFTTGSTVDGPGVRGLCDNASQHAEQDDRNRARGEHWVSLQRGELLLD